MDSVPSQEWRAGIFLHALFHKGPKLSFKLVARDLQPAAMEYIRPQLRAWPDQGPLSRSEEGLKPRVSARSGVGGHYFRGVAKVNHDRRVIPGSG